VTGRGEEGSGDGRGGASRDAAVGDGTGAQGLAPARNGAPALVGRRKKRPFQVCVEASLGPSALLLFSRMDGVQSSHPSWCPIVLLFLCLCFTGLGQSVD